MEQNRVKSKSLFNFRPTGVVDADIVEIEKAMMEEIGMDMNAMMQQMQAMSDEEYLTSMRGMMDGMGPAAFAGPVYSEV
jgi:hypothetical protein